MKQVSKSNLPNLLLSLERRVYDPDVRRSPELSARLFAEDFVEFGSNGVVYDKAGIVEALATGKPFDGEFRIEDFSVRELARDVVLVTYRLKAVASDGANASQSLRSTVYKQSDDNWLQLFHQATKVEM